ncbi:MAG: TonB C-terminal domain-containing protein [Candidatus Rokubacteria bacterium]|nr:TonB C-terminal domain-containing protein [Candidatus Rokubacteria bacterium]MBI3825998.1 TonB C-terminal domain-containing protein [Candidatus Rokubacteria bacterium]
MAAATLALRLRAHASLGPALGHAPIPVRTIALSTAAHVVVIAAIFVTGLWWRGDETKMPEILIVPSTALLGSPQGRPAQPPPTTTAPSTAAPSPPSDLPPAPRERPSSRELPPIRSTDAARLPDRDLARATLPRAGEKELPTAAPPAPAAPPSGSALARKPDTAPAAPPQGLPTGLTDGTGSVTIDGNITVSSLYLSRIFQKVTREWRPPMAAVPRSPIIAFDLAPTGRSNRVRIERSSLNPAYDQAALRAVVDADPFPPFPADLKEPVLHLHLRFDFVTDRG